MAWLLLFLIEPGRGFGRRRRPRARTNGQRKLRYAVVGLGYISQVAVLPAFGHAGKAELVALVSDDPVKLKKLSKKYDVELTYSYDDYDKCSLAERSTPSRGLKRTDWRKIVES